MERGYIKLWRKIDDCEALKERGKVFSKKEAWIHILMVMAQGVDNGEVLRGEFEASYRYLAKAWRWDVAKTYRFMEALIGENMLEKVKREVKHQMKHEAQHFKITNYETYNPSRNTNYNTERNKLNKGFKEGKKEDSLQADSSPSILFEIYDSENKRLPQVKARSQERLAKCRSRINQAAQSGCLEQYLQDFRAAVIEAQSTPFLCGDNARGWRADFDFLVDNHTNIYRILEGKYKSNGVKDVQSKAYKPDMVGATQKPSDLSPEAAAHLAELKDPFV